MSNQQPLVEVNDSDRPKDQHAVGFSVSLDDGLTRRAAMAASLGFLLFGLCLPEEHPPTSGPGAVITETLGNGRYVFEWIA